MGNANPERADPAERLAAVAALVAPLAAIAIVAVAAAANWQGIVITFIGLLLIVVAGWYVVSRRGVSRSVGVVIGLTGTGLLIAGFIVADLSLLTWVLVAVLALLSVVAARVALYRSKLAIQERTRSRSSVPPARHPALIMNPKSGGGKVEKFDVVQECHRRGIEPIVLERGDDLVQLAEDAISRGADVIGGRIFVNNASLGLYAKIVQSPEYRDAKLQTAASMLPEMLGPSAVPLDLRFTGPDGTSYPSAHLILVSNNPYQLASMAGRGTRERMDLGILGVVAARIADAHDASRFVALEAAGQIRRFPGWLEWTAPWFQVDSGGPVEIGVDGEALLMDPPLVFETKPGVLRVRLPRQARGLSPAARAVHVLSRSTIIELGQVLAGRRAD